MLLTCSNVKKKYINKEAVKDISLELERGRVYALLGPNGSGKTTLMKMIAGLTTPSNGEIKYDDKPLNHKMKAKIAYMPTEPFFYDYLTVDGVGKYYEDMFADFDMNKYQELIIKLELDRKQKCNHLSSGLAAKLKIAATLSRNAELYMLDEPLNGIDIIARDEIIDVIISTVREDCAMVISSHLVEELERIVDSVIFIRNGEVALAGDAEDIRSEHGMSIAETYKEVYKSKGGEF